MKNHYFFTILFILLVKIFALKSEIPPELQNLNYAIYPSQVLEYNTARFNYNKRFNVFPQAIFTPQTYDQVAYVLGVLKQYNLPFALRSGGHCYEPASLSYDYMIDTRNFNLIAPNVGDSTVFIGAGTRLGDVINTLGALNYAIPLGTCPTNCITGYTLGGGIGLLGRRYGLGCDSALNITFLTADLEVIQVNKNSYPDLYWALRGGGNGSYGIALGFTYKMYYVPAVSYLSLQWEWDPEIYPNVYNSWQKWVKTLPDKISTIFRLSYDHLTGKAIINVTALKSTGKPFTEWKRAFKKYGPKVTLFEGSYLDSSKLWATQSELPFNKGRSKIMMEPLCSKVIKKITNYFNKLAKDTPQFSVLFEFEAYGGKIAEFDTSFFPRKAFGWWYQETIWGNENFTEQALETSQKFYSDTSPEVSIYSYANTVDYDIGRCYMKAYYGNKAKRLIKVKDKYDPTNLFHWHQSVPLSKPKG